MTERSADPEIRLIPDYRDDEVPLPWYQDLGVCKRMDEQEKPDERAPAPYVRLPLRAG